MHIPDGFLDAKTAAVGGIMAVTGLALALRSVRRTVPARRVPLIGVAAAFVFAAQMLNFPVGAGTSGHLMGGALAAVLAGPWTAVLCMSVVLLVQGLVMADGGITALGTNITLMGLVTVAVGWGVFVLVRRVLPSRASMVAPAAAVGAFVSVPVAALVFTGLFAVGGTAPVDLGAVATTMMGWHTLIGLGEAAVTGLVVASVVATRPDLVHGARALMGERELEIRTPEVASQ
jgi:cobalt/nickel transport system permease protein